MLFTQGGTVMTLGERLKKARLAKGLSQTQLAGNPQLLHFTHEPSGMVIRRCESFNVEYLPLLKIDIRQDSIVGRGLFANTDILCRTWVLLTNQTSV